MKGVFGIKTWKTWKQKPEKQHCEYILLDGQYITFSVVSAHRKGSKWIDKTSPNENDQQIVENKRMCITKCLTFFLKIRLIIVKDFNQIQINLASSSAQALWAEGRGRGVQLYVLCSIHWLQHRCTIEIQNNSCIVCIRSTWKQKTLGGYK